MATCPSQQTTLTLRSIPFISILNLPIFNLRSGLLLLDTTDAKPPDIRARGSDVVRRDILLGCGWNWVEQGQEFAHKTLNVIIRALYGLMGWNWSFERGRADLRDMGTHVCHERGQLSRLQFPICRESLNTRGSNDVRLSFRKSSSHPKSFDPHPESLLVTA